MPKVAFSLIDQFSDIRSKEMSYKFLIENHGTVPITIMAINPRIPETVELVETQNPSIQATSVQYRQTCHEIEEILRAFLFVTVKEFRDKVAQARAEALVAMTRTLPTTLRVSIGALNRPNLPSKLELVRAKVESLTLHILNKADADSAVKAFMGSVADDDAIKKIVLEKVKQLDALEGGDPANTSAGNVPIAIIEPDSFFAITYVLRFPRSKTDPKKYNLDFEASLFGRWKDGKARRWGDNGRNDKPKAVGSDIRRNSRRYPWSYCKDSIRQRYGCR